MVIHKKRDIKVLKNYRPISFLSVAYKLFANVIANRISTTLDFNQPNDKAGFCKGCSTIDRLHTINQGIEKCFEYNQPLYIDIRDYEKVFDSDEISSVMKTLRNQVVDESYVEIEENIYR